MVKRVMCGLLSGLLIALAACSSPEEMSAAVGLAQARGEAAGTGERAQAMLERRIAKDARPFAMDDAERDGEAERNFAYSWPRQASAIPELARMLAADRDTRLAEQKSEWADARASCPPGSFACARNQLEVSWQLVADTKRFLSLSSSTYSYSGGAHGNTWRGALVWDREAGTALEPAALFVSLEALGAAIRPPACRLLDREREERRGESVPEGAGEWPDNCPPIEDTVIFLGSANGTHFDRIGVYYAPYTAGPYAEGDYEFTLPVSQGIVDAAMPQYRAAFALGS